MADAGAYLLDFGALVVLAPLAVLAGRRLGGRARGGLMLASILLGFGAVMDPPARHMIEAAEPPDSAPEPGEPPLD